MGNLDVGDNSRVRFSDSLLTVNGNILVHDSNNFYIDNSNLFCKGNFELSQSDGLTYSNSWITFYGTNYFYVGGNIDVYDKVYFDLSNTNTTIELKGDFNEIEYDSQYKSLSAYGNKDIKLILSGDHIQKIGYSTNNKDGIHLVLKNTSVSGVQFLTKTIPAGTIESNGCKVRCLGGGIYGWTLEEDMVMEGDLNLAQGELNLNGHTLKINGNFYAGRGNVDLNGGKLLVSGDLRMQSYDGKDTDYSEASVQMTEKEEYICVGGDFVIQSNSKTSSFSSGTLEVKGNFIRHPNCSDFYTPSASHMLVFSGENDQHIQCMFKSGRPFDFNHITIKPSKKESFVYFHSYTKIAGTISDLGKRSRMYSDNSANILLSVNNLEDIEQGYLGADVICSQNQEILNYDLNMDGLLALCKPFDLNGHKVNAGSFSMSAETLAINGGKIITKKECSLTDTKLIMNQKEDTISVSGDFSFHNGKSELTAGIIDIKGNVKITGDGFTPLSTHTTILSGKEDSEENDIIQDVKIESDISKFGELVLKKPINCYNFSPDILTISKLLSTVVKDEEAPKQVTELYLKEVGEVTLTLSWNPAYDNIGVSRYEIYRNGVKIASTMKTEYEDNGLEPGSTYEYAVIAVDFSKNRSVISERVKGTTLLDSQPPTKPANLRISRASGSVIAFEWGTSTDNTQVVGYAIYRDGQLLDEIGNELSYCDKSLGDEKIHTYKIRAFDLSGNYSEASNEVKASLKKPKIVDMLPCEGGTIGGNTTELILYYEGNSNSIGNKVRFQYSADDGVTWENINDSLLGQQGMDKGYLYSTYRWNISSLPSGPCKLRALLYDEDNSIAAKIINCTYDTEPPMTPDHVMAISNNGLVTLSWLPSVSADTEGYTIYRAEEGGTYHKVFEKDTYTDVVYEDRDVAVGKTYRYKVTAFDYYHNESAESIEVKTTVLADTEKPEVSLINTESLRICKTVNIHVEATDNIGVEEIRLEYLKGEQWIEVDGGNKKAEKGAADFEFDTRVVMDGSCIFRATATDVNGNVSKERTKTLIIDNTGISQIVLKDVTSDSDTVTLKWNTVEDEDFAYFSVEQLIDGEYTQIAKVVNTLGYQVTNLNENQTYTFRVVGYDDIGNEGIPSKKVVITTKDDVTPPEFQAYSVTNRNRFANNISINFKANDNQALDSLLIEYSTNCENWKQADIIEIPDNKKSYSGTYHLDVSNIREGNIFFRFTMTDLAGNCYLTNDKLPVLEYVIDRTSPDPVCNLKAESSCGYISLSWDEPTAKDDQYYFDIYRKEGDDGKYEKLVEDSTSLKYYDMKVQEGVRYFYKVITVDTAGNYSADSEIVSSKTEPDIEAPVIYSITPQNGSIIGKNQDIEIYVADNIEVADVMLAYKPVVSQDDYWYPISTISVNKQMKIIKTQWDISHLKEDSYKLRVIATDSSGNESKSYEVTYKLDREEPEAVVLSGKGAGYQSHLSWNSCNSTDFDHYEIYRKIEGKSYALYHELTDTVYTDTELNPGQKYSYKIYSYDKNGNYSVSNEVSTIPTDCDEIAPKAVVSEKISTKVGAETVFDGSSSTDNVGIKEYYWDFGNGDTAQGVSPKYTYYKTGSYEVTLTVTDIAGNQSTAKTSVEVREITASVLKVKVTNASGIGLHEAAVTIIQGERKEIIFTNQEGIASVALEGGIYEVYAYKEKYMPMKENCTLVTGVDKSMGFSLNEGEAVSAELTSRELSLQELRELKVDFSDPNNWYTREIEVWYYKENGEKGHVSDKTLIVGINEPIYWTNVDESYNFRLDIIETDKGPKEIYYLWITKEYLKDMFEVKLEITNNAEEDFSIIKGKAEINLPKGLSLLNVNKEQALLQKPEPISGGSSESIYWYIKGDEPGTYHISADFTGELSPIGMPISVKAETKNPIIVTNNKYTEITDDGFVGENKKEYNIYVSDSKGKPVKNAYVMLSYGGLGTASITNRQGRAKLYVDEYDKRQLKLLVRKSGYLNIVYESYTANCSLYQDFITLYKVGESIVPPETEDDKPSATPKGPQPPSSTAEPTPKPSAPDQWEFSLGVDEYNLEVPENIPFIGGSKLDLDLGYLPVSFQKEGNTFRIGLGTSNIFDNEYKWASFKNIVNKVSKSKETKEFLSSILDQGYKANSKFFPIEGEFRIYGYVEGTLKNNKITSAGGYIRFEIKAKGDKEWQTIVGPVPVVVKTKLEAGMEFTAKAGVDYGKKRIYSDSSIILTLPKITISAGIGFAKVADISVYGSAQNEMLFSTKDVFKLKGEAGISAKLLFASYKKAFIKGENVYYDSSKKNQKKIRALEKSSALYQAAENYVVERSKEKQGTDWNDQINMLTEEAVEAKEALSSVSNLAKDKFRIIIGQKSDICYAAVTGKY